MNYIFILSLHRTGSTLLKNMLSINSEVEMVFDEMNLFEPFRSETLDRLLGNSIKSPQDLIKAIENKKIYGTFWKDFNKANISKEELLSELEQLEQFDLQSIIKSILNILQRRSNKVYSGIKYPIHYSKVSLLKEWFPDSKIIFLTRNPHAIIASKLNDPASRRRKEKSVVNHFITHYFTLLYFCYEYNKSVKVFQKNKDNLYLITYEDITSAPQETLEKLCEFCNLKFEEAMLSADGKPSSYKNKSLLKDTERYKRVLSPFDQWLIKVLTDKSLKKFNTDS